MLNNQIRVTKSHFNISPDEIDLCTFPLLVLFAISHSNSLVIADMNMIHPATLNPKTIIKNIISAGAPVHLAILESFSRMLSDEAKKNTPYGATEAFPVTDIIATELLRCDPHETENESEICIGYPVEGLNVKIIEMTDNPIISWDQANQMSAGEIGEIVVKGPWVTTEYFNNPDANRFSKIPDPYTHEIWHRMGDLGKMDRVIITCFQELLNRLKTENYGTFNWPASS